MPAAKARAPCSKCVLSECPSSSSTARWSAAWNTSRSPRRPRGSTAAAGIRRTSARESPSASTSGLCPPTGAEADMRASCRTILILGLALAASLCIAQEYPARSVRVVVPFAPGGGTDIVARLLAQHLTQRLSQGSAVENQPAGSGIVGSNYVARAAPDGYTLLFAFSSLASSARLVSKLPYDPVADFSPITLATTPPLLLIVSASVPAKDVREFIAYAKANPGKLNYGSSGPGSSPHL